jgi:hypothetical protein
VKFAGIIGVSETADAGAAGTLEGLIAVDIPYPNPSMDPTSSKAIRIVLMCFLCSMIFPPFLDLRRNPALAYDYIIRREVNSKMTGRLQIGNVVGVCLTDPNGHQT